MLFRCIFSLLFWVTVARWGYQEIALFAPETTPYIDRFIECFTPPTHDQWEDISNFVQKKLLSDDEELEESFDKLWVRFEATYEKLVASSTERKV